MLGWNVNYRAGKSCILFRSFGGVAQLVERYVRNVEAEGSSPFTSTRVPYSNSDTVKTPSKGDRCCSWQSRPPFTSRRSNTAALNSLRVRSLALR